MRRALADRGVALACAVLAWAAAAHFRSDGRLRDEALAAMRAYHADERRPLDYRAAALAPSGDWAAGIAGEAAMSDAVEPVSLSGLTPRLRGLWIENAAQVTAELGRAQGLMLRAISSRPGWPYHWELLARLFYLEKNRAEDPAIVSRCALWIDPLRLAAETAPGKEGAARFLGAAVLETWPSLPPAVRQAQIPAVAAALADPDSVKDGFWSACQFLGPEEAERILPDDPAPIAAALQAAGEHGIASLEGSLYGRWVEAERDARARDLAEIEQNVRWGEMTQALSYCSAFVSRHPPGLRDGSQARRDDARVLALWPQLPGSWSDDGRGQLARYFLDRRTGWIRGADLARAIAPLSDVPGPVRARVAVLAGEPGRAEQLAREGDGAGSLDWTPVWSELARWYLRHGAPEKAAAALSRMAPEARDECDVMLLERDAARAGAMIPAGLPSGNLSSRALSAAAAPPAVAVTPGQGEAQMSFCFDPSVTGGLRLTLRLKPLESAVPAFCRFGWDGGISGGVLVPPQGTDVVFRLGGVAGLHTLAVEATGNGPAVSAAVATRPPNVHGGRG